MAKKKLPATRMHGTRSMFVAGCDCAKCRTANRAYMAAYMRDRRARQRRARELDKRERIIAANLDGAAA